jgi:uracil-DNA glycosylase family 4
MISRCSICPCVRGRNPIPPSGPSPCRILFLAERPARHEDEQGIPLADRGQSGMEFNNGYLPLCALYREDVAVSNAVLCSDKGYRNPKEHEAATCSAKHLPALLEKVNPQVIVTMGAISASLFPSISLVLHHGLPQPASYGPWSGIVFPTFHPAAGLRSTAYMIPLRKDFAALRLLLKDLDSGTFSWPSDSYPATDYSVLCTLSEFDAYLDLVGGIGRFNEHFYEFGTDTEFLSPTHPHCLTFSHTPGTARLIYADNKAILGSYASYLKAYRPLLSFHAYLADASPYASMGLPIDPRRFSDTMVRAYNLGIGGGGDDEDSGAARGSLGLKVLAYRHLNMKMQSFNDVVRPHALPLVYDYLDRATSFLASSEASDPEPFCMCGHPQSKHKEKGKSKRHSGYCLHEAEESNFGPCSCEKFSRRPSPKPDKLTNLLIRKLRGLSTKVLNDLLTPHSSPKPVDPWHTISEWHPWEIDLLYSLFGLLPEKSIALVPEKELVGYACPDADATLRLSRYLNTYRP